MPKKKKSDVPSSALASVSVVHLSTIEDFRDQLEDLLADARCNAEQAETAEYAFRWSMNARSLSETIVRLSDLIKNDTFLCSVRKADLIRDHLLRLYREHNYASRPIKAIAESFGWKQKDVKAAVAEGERAGILGSYKNGKVEGAYPIREEITETKHRGFYVGQIVIRTHEPGGLVVPYKIVSFDPVWEDRRKAKVERLDKNTLEPTGDLLEKNVYGNGNSSYEIELRDASWLVEHVKRNGKKG